VAAVTDEGALLETFLRMDELTRSELQSLGRSASAEVIERIRLRLRASEQRYHSLFNSIDEGFCVIEMEFDPDDRPTDFKFLETNPAFENQSGLHAVAGKRIRQLAPNLEAHWFETYGHVALTGESIRFINESQVLDGRWFDVYAFRLEPPESRRVAVLFKDITERRRLEQQTQEQAKSLADLNSRKDQFLAVLSHEVRNPLASIRYAADLLRLHGSQEPPIVEAQQVIDRQVSQLASLFDDLLDVTRISTGVIRLHKESVDLRAIVNRAADSVKPMAHEKGQSLLEVLPARPVRLEGDAARLEQVVVNLLINSCKYTKRGGTINVTLRQEDGEAVVSVRDNGLGIPADFLPRIFDLFTQVDQSLARTQGGLGIGLALVRSLVTLHGGRVDVQSVLGEGSEFVVRLPVVATARDSKPRAAEIVEAPVRALRVLIVDDEPDVARSSGRLLRTAGYDIQVEVDATIALQVATKFAPDVVLLDVGMPIVDGLQLAQWLRREPALKDVLLVALTGYGQDSDRQRTKAAGFDHHLVKPVRFAEIEKILATAPTRQC